MSDFHSLGLDESILRAVAEAGYVSPTPIQAEAIPLLLDQRDVLGVAQTGTGKTAAFVLPVLQRLLSLIPERGGRVPRALILAPTRELAIQIGESIQTYAKYLPVRHDVVYGGVNIGPQLERLRRGVDLIVATPGRLLEILDRGNVVSLKNVDFFILDEADRMLDMGFIRDIKRVITFLPQRRQTLLFSATMPSEITELSSTLLHRAVRVEVAPPATTGEKIAQQLHFVEGADKPKALVDLVKRLGYPKCIVFTRTKHGANRVVKVLDAAQIPAMAIHGNKSQNHRERALAQFRDGEIPLLIATDIASRGIDVEGVSHVINYDLPDEADVYVHRIGRTGRAGKTGIAIAFCADEERGLLYDILRITQQGIDIVNAEGEVIGREEVPRKGDRRPPSPKRPVRGQRPQGDGGGGRRQQDGRRQDGRRQEGARPPAERSAPAGARGSDRPAAARPAREDSANPSGQRRRAPAPGSRPARAEGGNDRNAPRQERPGEGAAQRPKRTQNAPRPPQDYSAAAMVTPGSAKSALPSDRPEGERLRRSRR